MHKLTNSGTKACLILLAFCLTLVIAAAWPPAYVIWVLAACLALIIGIPLILSILLVAAYVSACLTRKIEN